MTHALSRHAISKSLWDVKPCLIASLHLPDLALARHTTMAELEDYVLSNAAVFVEGGIPAIMLQDMTRVPDKASAEVLAIMGALGRGLRLEFPDLVLGIIMRAHDPAAALAVAHAVGASFVRIKVYVGGVMSAEGPRDGLAVEARAYRHQLRRDDIAILADVHDRMSVPRSSETHETSALWAQQLGADGLIVTGADFDDTIGRVRATRAAGVRIPILIGGGVTDANVAAALGVADGAIVSTSLMRPGVAPTDVARWDVGRCRALMDKAALGRAELTTWTLPTSRAR